MQILSSYIHLHVILYDFLSSMILNFKQYPGHSFAKMHHKSIIKAVHSNQSSKAIQ